jgi:N-acetylglucosaminyldiphosphoundecaprenol N-acetyl-beta-D-mannosaminyltransferase
MFFLGATEITLRLLEEQFRHDFPRLIIAGTLAPPFRITFTPEDEEKIVKAVNSTQAEVLWIGLGAPKQEKLALRLRERLNVHLIGPVGGVFDFYTGRVKLPPAFMQRLGLIWLFRLFQEPRRLFRRNLDSPIFLFRVILQRLRHGRVYG